jgi:hypothetical protein
MSEALNKIYDATTHSLQWGCYRDEKEMGFVYQTETKLISIVVPAEDSEYNSFIAVRRWEGKRVKYEASLYYFTLEGHVEDLELGPRIEKKAQEIFDAI